MKRFLVILLLAVTLLCLASSAQAMAYDIDPSGTVGTLYPTCDHVWGSPFVDYGRCTDPAYAVYVCQICGYQRVEQVPPPGHNWVEERRSPGDCYNGGTVYYRCSRCGETKTEATPALGHDWGDWQTVIQATCTESGLRQRVCRRDDSHVERETIPASGSHNWGEWFLETPGDCTNPELRRHTCTVCGKTEYQYWGYGDHVWGDWEIVTEPNCTFPGLRRRVCTINREHVQEESVPVDPDAHDWGEWHVVVAPQEDTMGMEERVCRVNAEHRESRDLAYGTAAPPPEPEPAPDHNPVPPDAEGALRLLVKQTSEKKPFYVLGEIVTFDATLFNVGHTDLEDCKVFMDNQLAVNSIDYGDIPAGGDETREFQVEILQPHVDATYVVVTWQGIGYLPGAEHADGAPSATEDTAGLVRSGDWVEQLGTGVVDTLIPPVEVEYDPELTLSVVCLDVDPFYFDGAGQTGDIYYQAVVTNTGLAPCTVTQIEITTAAGTRTVDVGPFLLYPNDSTGNILLSNNFSESEKTGAGTLEISFKAIGLDEIDGPHESNVVPLSHRVGDIPPWVIPPATDVTVWKEEISLRPTTMGYRLNDTVKYRIWVYNDSPVAIPLLEVEDPLVGEGVVIGIISDLDSYTSNYVELSYVVTQPDVDHHQIVNTAKVSWTDPESQEKLTRPSNTVTVPTTDITGDDDIYGVSIKITFEKGPANGSFYVEGEEFPIRVDWKNSSGKTLYHVRVHDDMADWMGAVPGGYLVDDGTLAPDETGTFTYTYKVDDIDVDFEAVTDWAEIIGYDSDGKKYYNEDGEWMPAGKVTPPEPGPDPKEKVIGLKVEKVETSKPGEGRAYYIEGETITYSITITNTGNVDLTDVTVADSLSDTFKGAFATITTLHASESRTYSFSYEVTKNDVPPMADKVINYAIGYYTYDDLIDVPVVSDPVISPTGPVPGPVPPYKPDGHIETPVCAQGKDDACVMTLVAKGDGTAEYVLKLCSKHQALYDSMQSSVTAFKGSESGVVSAYHQASVQWKAALDEIYDEILKAATGEARMTVMAERASFYAYVESFKALKNLENPDAPAAAEHAAAELLMRQCAELCYVTHFAQEERPDSLFFATYGQLPASSGGEECVLAATDAADGIHYLETMCQEHTETDVNTLAMIRKAKTRATAEDAFKRARRAWQSQLNASVTEAYKAADAEGRGTIAACRKLLDELLGYREGLYGYLYPDHPETVAEVLYRAVVLDVVYRCK